MGSGLLLILEWFPPHAGANDRAHGGLDLGLGQDGADQQIGGWIGAAELHHDGAAELQLDGLLGGKSHRECGREQPRQRRTGSIRGSPATGSWSEGTQSGRCGHLRRARQRGPRAVVAAGDDAPALVARRSPVRSPLRHRRGTAPAGCRDRRAVWRTPPRATRRPPARGWWRATMPMATANSAAAATANRRVVRRAASRASRSGDSGAPGGGGSAASASASACKRRGSNELMRPP